MDKSLNRQLTLLAGALLLWLIIYHETLVSMVSIWWRSGTFAHGFLIFPISLFLIWKERARFLITDKKPSILYAFGLLMLVLIWSLANAVDVSVIKQLMVILMIPFIVAALFGYKLLKAYRFPLFYLLFAVPFGEFLIPKLQQLTAMMTVFGLKLTGIPVYSEGMYISIPSGDFEVAVACSGIRYLIASLALGTLYAHLTFTKVYKRWIFIAASLIVPIIANGVRAYGIVMMAHLSGMKYATGVDHLIYGWLFFGIVIFILFFIGSFWKDKAKENEIILDAQWSLASVSNYQGNQQILLLITLILLVGPISTYWLNYQPEKSVLSISVPELSDSGWNIVSSKDKNWEPVFTGTDQEILTTFSKGSTNVSLYIAYYASEAENKELVANGNRAFNSEKNKLLSKQVKNLKINNEKIELEQFQLRYINGNRLIMGWYYVFNKGMVNKIKIKLFQVLGKISGLSRGGCYVAYAIDFHDININKAEQKLLDFISLSWPEIKQNLVQIDNQE